MPKCMHTVEAIDAHKVEVHRQPYEYLCPAYKLSYTDASGDRKCIVVIARTSFAVRAMAKRVLGKQGCSDFTVGRYLGSRHPAPSRNRQRKATGTRNVAP